MITAVVSCTTTEYLLNGLRRAAWWAFSSDCIPYPCMKPSREYIRMYESVYIFPAKRSQYRVSVSIVSCCMTFWITTPPVTSHNSPFVDLYV